jgi:hypothetical protein
LTPELKQTSAQRVPSPVRTPAIAGMSACKSKAATNQQDSALREIRRVNMIEILSWASCQFPTMQEVPRHTALPILPESNPIRAQSAQFAVQLIRQFEGFFGANDAVPCQKIAPIET